MTESHILLLLVGLVTLCTVAATAVFLRTAGDLRRLLSQLHRFLSHCDQTRLQAEHTLGVARRLLTRADQTAGQVQGVLEKGCEAAETALDQISFLKGKVASLWPGHAGNGGRRSRSRKIVRIGIH